MSLVPPLRCLTFLNSCIMKDVNPAIVRAFSDASYSLYVLASYIGSDNSDKIKKMLLNLNEIVLPLIPKD